ncbi:MAG: hypothetical protein J0H49_02925 [Acidobacteria bacterium]|nr:hypothetical protein [Acidobacteriota bacterium]
MSELATLLEKQQIRRVLVVDDAFDAVPTAVDLLIEEGEWTQFFEDLEEPDLEVLRGIYPGYDNERADRLRQSDTFIAALWQHGDKLRADLLEPLFSRYRHDTETDLQFLNGLKDQLIGLGLQCETAGRKFASQGISVDLLIVDLFLGSSQQSDDIDQAVKGVAAVSSARVEAPPLVILMSRSPRLESKRADFRDRACLFESAFRIISKADLADLPRLKRVLSRLAYHYRDSLKLSAFLNAWQTGVQRASERASELIRRLDLTDIAQIRRMLLDAEGVSTGSYLVDVFDKAFQYELESQAAIIDAAIGLNSLNESAYPPPYLDGSKELQQLVNCALFQNHQRLRLPGSQESKVAFGDLLWRKQRNPPAEGEPADFKGPLSAIGRNQVVAVMSPACDLQRQGAKRIILLVGEVRAFSPTAWTYNDDPIRTPVMRMSNGESFWIKWDLKHIETISHAELDVILEDPRGLTLAARLRESPALELQQKLLSDLGRVGLAVPMPATFKLSVDVYVPDLEKRPRRLNIPLLDQTGGVRFVGRVDDSDATMLVLSEPACDAICQEIEQVDLASVHEKARAALDYLRSCGDLLLALERGVVLPSSNATSWKDIPSPTGALTGEGAQAKIRTIGWVGNKSFVEAENRQVTSGELYKAGILLSVGDVS